jgi:hypothetical protein
MDLEFNQERSSRNHRTCDGKETTMASDSRIEKFPVSELAGLRTELLQSNRDSWQGAELVTTFLSGRGYGADPAMVREAVLRLEANSCNVECMQRELEQVAWSM